MALAIFLTCAVAASAQDPLRSELFRSLRSLPEVTVLIQQPQSSAGVDNLIATLGLDARALGNAITVGLATRLPKLGVSQTFRDDKPFLEFSWYGNATALALSLNLWRWARLQDSSESVFAPMWTEQSLMIAPNRQAVRDKLDDLLNSFAAAYLRTNPQVQR